MIEWATAHMNWLFVALFVGHLVSFVWLSWRRRTLRFGWAIAAFSFLIVLNMMRATNVDVTLANLSLQAVLRVLAIAAAAVSISEFVRRRLASHTVTR